MKILQLTLITHRPDAVTGELVSPATRFAQVVESARVAEELGFDGFAVGERHEDPFISSSPPVVLSHIAAVTDRIRLFTGVTTLSLLDPVRAVEDYSTLDNLSGGRLELIIGKGNGAAQAQLFHVTPDDQWDRNTEGYELFRALWRSDSVTWTGRFRPSLRDAKVLPRPLQPEIRTWHGSATSPASVELAALHGDPVFSANVTHPIEPYARLIDHYRQAWVENGRDPADAVVGAGSAGVLVAPTSQEARALYAPIFAARKEFTIRTGLPDAFTDLDDFITRSSALVGSPAEVIDKVGRYHDRLGHEVLHISADSDGLTPAHHRRSLDLFAGEVAPALRAAFPSRPLGPVGATPVGATPVAAH
ncbi:LLM class flavin-dependent oxidoreductase [Williamsia deligens]|uniref:LLM class flavin-dependent oxidoreductase n=1 Tax=Williamsia deligens TaxID=321325 RepID=A0ABW3G6I1_9NOCA|nr:LLM class flavin-dependent oxidoreductase [Williamsia deligens]